MLDSAAYRLRRMPLFVQGFLAAATLVLAPAAFAQTSPKAEFMNSLIPTLHNPAAFGWTILLVGFVTASLVQWAKDLLGWRAHFHQKIVSEWVCRRADSPAVSKLASEVRPKSDSKTEAGPDAISQLEKLIGGTMESAGSEDRPRQRVPASWLLAPWPRDYLPAYSLPAEQLCGQLASAAEVTIATPDRYPELFAVLIATGAPPPSKEIEEYLKASENRASKDIPSDDQRYADLRAQFMLRAQRSLDNLQILMGQQWRRRLTVACLYCSCIFGLLVVDYFLEADATFNAMAWYERFGAWLKPVVIVTVAGALIAPLAHDLTLAIRSFRRP